MEPLIETVIVQRVKVSIPILTDLNLLSHQTVIINEGFLIKIYVQITTEYSN